MKISFMIIFLLVSTGCVSILSSTGTVGYKKRIAQRMKIIGAIKNPSNTRRQTTKWLVNLNRNNEIVEYLSTYRSNKSALVRSEAFYFMQKISRVSDDPSIKRHVAKVSFDFLSDHMLSGSAQSYLMSLRASEFGKELKTEIAKQLKETPNSRMLESVKRKILIP